MNRGGIFPASASPPEGRHWSDLDKSGVRGYSIRHMRRLRFFLPAVLYYAGIFILSAQPHLKLPIRFDLADKAAHFLLYAGFGVCLAYGLARLNDKAVVSRPMIIAGLGFVLGGLDEIHQMFVPGRNADILDALVDVLGVLAGWMILRTWVRRTARRRSHP